MFPLRHFLIALALAAGLDLSHAAKERPPNIVFILADDLGWADTTLYGHTRLYRTPNIERLAKRGMTFTHAYSDSPLCSPTRSAILTGLSPARTGITTPSCHLPQVVLEASPGKRTNPGLKAVPPVVPTRLRTDYHTLPEALKEAGYATGHFGKWHLGKEPYSPLEHGFEVDVPHWPGPGPAGSYVAPWKFPDFDPDTPDQHIEDRMAKEAVTFLEGHQDGPFFLNYWMFSVHAPFDAKKELVESYRKKIDPKDPQRSPTYAAMIESMDDAVGTLLDTLDRLKLTENTIIVFFSDNGGNMYNEIDGTTPTSNAPLRGGKASMYEGGIRVPCIVSWPGRVKAGCRSEAVIQGADFFPTFLDILDRKPKAGQEFDGISFLPALIGKPLEREAIFTYFPHNPAVPDWLPPAVAVHRGDWKLIRLFFQGEDGAHRWKLFNLREDEGERNDLAAKRPDLARELDGLIEEFLVDTNAVLPVRNPAFDPAQYDPTKEGIQFVRERKKPKSGKKDDPFDPLLKGWKARNTEYEVKNGIVTLTSKSANAFLGTGAAKDIGPATVTFRVHSAKGGPGKVEWVVDGKPQKPVPFTLKGDGWEEQTVEVAVEGALGILRIYLPAQRQPVEVDWIELKPQGKGRRWDF